MNTLIVLSLASLCAYASASGHVGVAEGAALIGPSGIVTNQAAIGHVGLGLGGVGGLGLGGVGIGVGGLGLGLGGLGHGGAILQAPSAAAIVSGPALGIAHAAPIVAAAPLAVAAPVGLGAITNGGGTIGVSGHGAAIRGPPTAPVVVAGPSGKIAADGLWGPTANIGLGAHGKGW